MNKKCLPLCVQGEVFVAKIGLQHGVACGFVQ